MVSAGRVGITAGDADGNMVVIELKAGTDEGWNRQPWSTNATYDLHAIYGKPGWEASGRILVPNEFHPWVVPAAQD